MTIGKVFQRAVGIPDSPEVEHRRRLYQAAVDQLLGQDPPVFPTDDAVADHLSPVKENVEGEAVERRITARTIRRWRKAGIID